MKRSLAGPALVLASVAVAVGLAAAPPDRGGATPLARAVHGVEIVVADVDRAVDFYSRVLTFEKVSDLELAGPDQERLHGLAGARLRAVGMRLGDERLELIEFLSPRGRPVPPDSRSNDRWFQHAAIVVSDMDGAYERLRRHRVEHVSPAPQRLPDWNPAAGGIRAFYFKDPDGHVLEILQFPPGKGEARWHAGGGRLFLGIDHTAIVVGDTETSVRFYRDLLGMRIAGASANHGPEQERLNAVPGARLRITTLRAPAGPGVELLEYLAPRDGRPLPAGARLNDLLAWRTVVWVDDARAARRALEATGAAPAAPAVGEPRAVVARDPDGHAILLRSR